MMKVIGLKGATVMDVGNVAGKPGSGGKIARKIGDAGVNIDLIYFAEHNKLVLGVDNMEKARAALDKG